MSPIIRIGVPLRVPANSSRFFNSHEEALNQEHGLVQLTLTIEKPYIHNDSFNSKLIKHDSNYCTSDSIHLQETLKYFSEIISRLDPKTKIIEIGCGQGEFVIELRARGFDAIGFDPVCKTISPFLHRKYWNPDDKNEMNEGPILYIMRCVLPHISDPWNFLDRILGNNDKARILIEYQRLEWIVENRVWYQLSHDHVNIFSDSDLEQRYEVYSEGTFSDDEWAFRIVGKKKTKKVALLDFNQGSLEPIFASRGKQLEVLANEGRSVVCYGAAGKGIVFLHALNEANKLLKKIPNIIALDSDKNRWGKFLEGSGTLVYNPSSNWQENIQNPLILVMNPRHLKAVQMRFGSHHQVITPTQLE